MDHACAMPQTHHVAGPTPVGKQRFDAMFYAPIAEVAQKRISRAQRQECQRRTLTVESLGIKAVHDFIRSAIATDRDKVPDAALIGFARNLRRLSRSARYSYGDFDAARPQTLQRGAQQFAAPPAPRRRIHNRKIDLPQGSRSVFTASNCSAG